MLQRSHQSEYRPAPAPFRINPELDVEALARAYREEGKVRIFSLLADGAVELFQHLEERDDWFHLITTDEGVIEITPEKKALMSADEWARIEGRAYERARDGQFQYRYHALRVPEAGHVPEEWDLVGGFAALMESDPMLDLLRAVTGHQRMRFTDGQVTAYDAGDFLTGHDDGVEGKDRLAAYVFGLTPRWRLEWGGLLLFHGPMDRTVSGMVPRFNTLDLFSVPQQHSVSEVTKAATHRRRSITGWLSSREV